MQISVSDLKLYLQCPRAYKLHAIDEIEPPYKSLSLCRATTVRQVIAALHDGEKSPCDYTREEIDTICKSAWHEEITDAPVNYEELDMIVVQEKPANKNRPAVPAIMKGERILKNIQTWCFEYTREEIDAHVLYSNVYFQTTIGDTSFVGFLDQVRRHPDLGLQILSFNTSCQPPTAGYLERDFTLSLQSHALWQGSIFPKYPDLSEEIRLEAIPSVYLYYFPNLERYQRKNGDYKKGDRKGNPLIHVPRSQELLLDFEYELLYTVSGIQSGFFPMMPSSPAGCSLCRYAHSCNGTNSVFSMNSDVSFNIEEFEEVPEAHLTSQRLKSMTFKEDVA